MPNVLYRQDLNRGLATTFGLVNGRVQLTGGEAKAENNVQMLLTFLPWFRLQMPDYIPDVLWAYQKNSSVVARYKNVFRLKLLRAADKHCPFVEVDAVDSPIDPVNRRGLVLDIQFRYRLDPESRFRAVRFLT